MKSFRFECGAAEPPRTAPAALNSSAAFTSALLPDPAKGGTAPQIRAASSAPPANPPTRLGAVLSQPVVLQSITTRAPLPAKTVQERAQQLIDILIDKTARLMHDSISQEALLLAAMRGPPISDSGEGVGGTEDSAVHTDFVPNTSSVDRIEADVLNGTYEATSPPLTSPGSIEASAPGLSPPQAIPRAQTEMDALIEHFTRNMLSTGDIVGAVAADAVKDEPRITYAASQGFDTMVAVFSTPARQSELNRSVAVGALPGSSVQFASPDEDRVPPAVQQLQAALRLSPDQKRDLLQMKDAMTQEATAIRKLVRMLGILRARTHVMQMSPALMPAARTWMLFPAIDAAMEPIQKVLTTEQLALFIQWCDQNRQTIHRLQFPRAAAPSTALQQRAESGGTTAARFANVQPTSARHIHSTIPGLATLQENSTFIAGSAGIDRREMGKRKHI